ncbi:MAG TPA: acyl-CoA dehydrogenase family protein, partial [Caulobacterales bacterium]|nr:acyl-CoA dehydrogenase family protein [Caulobacterales bacterium]
GAHAVDLPIAEAILDSANVNDRELYMAMMLSAKMAGALSAALDLSVDYTRQRQQFGKPLASFQAIQQQLAVLAEEAAAAEMAAASAFRAADLVAEDGGDAWFEIACAKLRANQAARIGTGIAHQVHGAMGFTAEYRLQHLTRRLWAWGSECGNERYWAGRIGARIAERGAKNFWPDLVG